MSRKSEVRDKAPGPPQEVRCLRHVIVDEVNRRMAAGECSGALLRQLVDSLADLLSADPRAGQRAAWLAHIAKTLPRLVSEKVDIRLERDPDYLRNTIELNEGMVQ